MRSTTLLLSFCILIINCQFFNVNSSAQGIWTQKANFGGTARSGAISISIGTKGYIGLGNDAGGNKNDFWEYDPGNNTWTQKANYTGGGSQMPIGFSIGTKGYVGTGWDGSNWYQDFWEYDPSTNIWLQKANVGGPARRSAVGFSIGAKGYVGTGNSGSSMNDFWEYDPAANNWVVKTNFGGTAREFAVGFSIGNKGYIGTGNDGTKKNDFWEYSALSNTWTQKANFGGTARHGAAGFSAGGKGYIGLGEDVVYRRDCWEYNPAGNNWVQVADFGGTGRFAYKGFSIGSNGYIGCGYDSTGFKNDFWQFVPACSISLSTSTTSSACGQATGTASVVATGGNAPYTYQWTNGDQTAFADSLSAGLYMILVTDASGCTDSKPAMVSDAAAPTVSVTAVADVSCNGGSNGSITLSATGGTPPYTFLWANGNTNQNMSNLQAGPHQVQVTDANGCKANKIVLVNEPDKITLADSIQNASCGNADGAAAVNASGGTPPFAYAWSTGATTQIVSNLAAGSYSVLVTDNKGCTKAGQGTIINLGAATATLDSVVPAKCGVGTGSIYISVTGGSPPYTYVWTNGATTQDLTGAVPGMYGVTVYSNGNPCTGAFSAVIPAQGPIPPVICIVTVDSSNGKNQCAFVKDSIAALGYAKYNFYRETTTAGVYQKLGSKPANQISLWTDQSANPVQRAWRYKITAEDTCGNESPISVLHKTIHLVANLGLNNTVNLIWDDYEGFSYGTFVIYRYTPATGWDSLTALPSNLHSYTDNDPSLPSPIANVHYFIEVKPPSTCVTFSAHKDTEATNLNSSKSNVYKLNTSPTAVSNVVLESMTSVYPNPSSGAFVVYGLQPGVSTLSVYDMCGKKVHAATTNKTQETVNLQLPDGIYFLQIKNDKEVITKKLILKK